VLAIIPYRLVTLPDGYGSKAISKKGQLAVNGAEWELKISAFLYIDNLNAFFIIYDIYCGK